MEKELGIYVSASPEMDAECEFLGQILARLPQAIRWTIKRTPGPHEGGNPDLKALHASQFYLILLGMDISAPVGVEWLAARGTGLRIFAYRNVALAPSPAAAVFAREARIVWEEYHTPQEFARRFEEALISALVQGTPGYGLELADIEELSTRLKALEKDKEEKEPTEERRGAGRGGVILPVS